MASAKQQKPVNEACPQEQHKFWGSKVFGGNKQNTDQQNNSWWFGSHKQGQHCSTCQCSTPDKSQKPTTPCEGMNMKEHQHQHHTLGVTIQEEKIKRKDEKSVLKNSAKMEEKAHGGSLVHGSKNHNVCTDAKSKGKKEESGFGVSNNKANVNIGPGVAGKKKDQKEQHCFRSMAGHVKQRIAMMKSSHDTKSSDSSSSSSDSEDEKTHKKKKEKGQSHGVKITAK